MVTTKKMTSEAFAVTGYAADAALQALSAGGAAIEIYAEPGNDEVGTIIEASDIDHVRSGHSVGGHTLVQIVLKSGAKVQTVVRSKANAAGMQRLNDPLLQRLQQSVHAKVIFIG